MKRLFLFAALVLPLLSASAQKITPEKHIDSNIAFEADSAIIIPFSESGEHAFRIADTQMVTDMGGELYSVNWYVDTEEWDWDPMTNHIFSKIDFKKGDKVLASFCDDDGWSYIAVENSKAKMFKSFKLDSDNTAVVFRGGAYAAGVPVITIFILCGDEVRLIFNKEYFIEKIETDKILIKHEIDKPVCGHLSFSGGHISIVSDEFPNGKTVF